MKKYFLLSVCFVFLGASLTPAQAQLCTEYQGHLDLEGKVGNKRNIGETSAFLPVAYNIAVLEWHSYPPYGHCIGRRGGDIKAKTSLFRALSRQFDNNRRMIRSFFEPARCAVDGAGLQSVRCLR